VVAQLIELGYLDDEAFARAWIESRDRAGRVANSLFDASLARRVSTGRWQTMCCQPARKAPMAKSN
jgi:SOS response regulatory protein OraA/RecX